VCVSTSWDVCVSTSWELSFYCLRRFRNVGCDAGCRSRIAGCIGVMQANVGCMTKGGLLQAVDFVMWASMWAILV